MLKNTMPDNTLNSSFGDFELQRRPLVSGLKAWDGADEYLLELAQGQPSQSALIINDNFGALACALHQLQPTSWSDSHTTHLATQENYARNLLPETFTALASTDSPTTDIDLVLWRVPKSTSLFEQQIARLRAVLTPETIIFVGGMDKHLLPNTKELLTRLGKVTTLAGKRKSHVFRVEFDPSLPSPFAPKNIELALPEYDLTISGDANVFAREKLDIGARFFIEQFAQLPKASTIADIGCGNGVLSLAVHKLQPQATVYACDESYQAIVAARANWQRNFGAANEGNFAVDDGLSNYQGEPFDLILCNPPFHQQHVIGDHIARQLFTQSKKHLAPGGQLWVVGNRHLDYHIVLKKIFGNCRQQAANQKFVVLVAQR